MADHDNKVELKLKPMDPELAKAAWTGDLRFLRKAVGDCEANNNNDYSYFLSTHTSPTTYAPNDDEIIEIGGNIFHLAAWKGRVELFKEAMESLSTRKQSIVQVLLSHQEEWWTSSYGNPLHVAARRGAVEIVKIIQEFYTSLPAHPSTEQISSNDKNSQPWLAQDLDGKTPLHVALKNKEEECAKVLMSMDVELLVTNITDKDRNSPLFLAVENGWQQVALEILNSAHPYSLSGSRDQTALHVVPNCSEQVCRLLVEKHPQLLKAVDISGCTVMHSWIFRSDGGARVWPFEYLLLDDTANISPELRMDFLELLIATDQYGENPLHYAAKCKGTNIARILGEAYQKERSAKKTTLSCLFENPVPWLRQNHMSRTPVDIAQYGNNEEVALCFLSPEFNSILDCQDYMNNYLLQALQKKWYKFAQGILDIQKEHGWSTGLTSGCGRNVLHNSSKYKEEVATWLVTHLPEFIWEQDDDGKTPFYEASEANATWLIDAMLNADPSFFKKEPTPWVEACNRGDSRTIRSIIRHCLKFRDVCIEVKDTPLHHLRLESGYQAYQDFLKIPMMWEFKNFRDSNGATPLHEAIRNHNIHLTEALLTIQEVDRSIKDNKGNSPMDLLADVCLKEPRWDEMCQRIGIIPGLKTTYFQDKTNLLEVRNTLSVVAALLATITFTAGFTLPGGFNSDSGKAILGEKAAFIVFLLADVLAMCCSMLVLVFFIWSMVCDKNKSLVLIDRSIPLLMLALYSTLLAFMTGIYIIMPHKSLWVVIVVLIMCSLIIVSSKRSFMFKVLDKLNPGANGKRKDKYTLMEQGTSTSTVKEGSSSEQNTERATAAEEEISLERNLKLA